MILRGLNLRNVWEGNTLNACYDSWIKQVPKYSTFPSIVIWHVWMECNKVIFENGSPSICSVVYKSLGGFDRLLVPQKLPIFCTNKALFWDWSIVCWFDGATISNGLQSGAGG